MTELKTLKDIFGNVDCECGAVKTYEHYLKAEAIKWLKSYENCKHPTINENVKLFIKHFFNLTEEDLK